MSKTVSSYDAVAIGPISLRNRFIKSGANEGMSPDGVPSAALLKHHHDIAAGGVGMTTVAYGAVSKVGRTLGTQTWIRREILPDLEALASAAHGEGAKISMQITHGGSFVTQLKVKGPTMSSSGGINQAGLLVGNFFQREMTEADMAQVIGEFVEAAKICREAGFDAVEIHMGHGYLLNQFISPLSNKRKDQYGGSAENRVRFPARVLAAVKAAVGADMAVLAKINVADGVKKGATVEDAIVTAKALEAAGADMLVLSGGRNIESTWFMFGSNVNWKEVIKLTKSAFSRLMIGLVAKGEPKVTFREMYFLEYSRKIRAAVKVPLAFLGGVNSLASAEAALREGFECVVMARPLLHDPELINKFKNGSATKSGCTTCNRCVAYIYHPAGTWCVLNPPNDPQLIRRRASA